MAVDLEQILEPGYLGDLRARPMDEVRGMRGACQEVESGLSLLRRLVQGRLDIIGVELSRRASGGDPGDLPELIAKLPDVLSDRTHAPGVGRLPQVMVPEEMPAELESELDAIVSPVQMTDLASLTDQELARIADGLDGFERRVSEHRQALFGLIDTLQAEITRRYREGEASVDALLE